MKRLFTPSTQLANYLALTILALVPFQAFLTVWVSSFTGHYVLLRLWDDALLAVLLGIVTVRIARDAALRTWFSGSLLVRLILAYAGLTLLLGIISLLKHDVTIKALAYGLLINMRYLLWFLAIIAVSRRTDMLARTWPKAVLVPAAIVVCFGVLQYTVLPHNFLSHFGYNSATIAPIETINHNQHYIRVQSTLRGANPLGAYLVIVIALAASYLLRSKRKIKFGLLAVAALLALYASGSRSAWIGSFLTLVVIAWSLVKTRQAKIKLGIIAGLIIVVLGGLGLVLRNNIGFENAVLHTQKHSAVVTGSNSAHASALKSGVSDVVHQPFGDGPGTAGQASVYNGTHPARIAEDYYVQIAQETGWLGLVLFLSIIGLVASELYRRRINSPFALVVLASLVGILFVNLLSHAWSDDTLAFVWWGLAGIAVAEPVRKGKDEIQD